MREDITNQFDFVIGTLQICIGILQKMKGEEKSKYPMHVGLLTEMIKSFEELREDLKKEIDTPVN